MFLKALTIKGFKSFADTAGLDLEPGITVVVGPNGSGKSNVVDAIAWVLGAQAPTAVRSQKMDDVIFAGTSSRKPLGRAEVALTIDNGDGELPIEFNEVTLSRTLFRSGDSDYAINGVSCRLLDIQELLSDSGVGRQQHIIISQGRIDDVLNAKPEDRRGIIEEAAGVLKYRKRKERAERRLAATEENLNRLKDLLREVRRQLRPLEKQAAAAQRHGELVAELGALKLHLAGREIAALTGQLEATKRQRRESGEGEERLTSTLATLDAQVLEGESSLAALGASDVVDVSSRAQRLRERIRGQHNVVAERRRRLESELQAAVDDTLVADLEAEAARLAGELQVVEADGRALRPSFAHLAEAEARLTSEQLTFDTEWGDELAPKPTRAPELRAQLEALERAGRRSAVEIERLDRELGSIEQRRAAITNDRSAAATTILELERALPDARAGLAATTDAHERAEVTVEERTEARREADSEASRWQARRDALAQALDEARSRAGADALAETDGFVGALLDLVAIDEGWELAVEAAAGEALAAIVVDSPTNAAKALDALQGQDLAGAVLALNRPGGTSAALAAPSLPPPGRGQLLRGRVRSRRADLDPLLDALFAGAVVTDGDWRSAMDLALADPGRVVVTRSGDRFGPGGWRIGLSGTGATGAALDEAQRSAEIAIAAAEAAATALDEARAAHRAATATLRDGEEEVRRIAADLDRAVQTRDRSGEQLAQLDEDRQRLDTQRRAAAQQDAADRAAAERIAAELPAVENEEAEYLNRVEALTHSRTSLEERTRSVAESRRELEVKAAAIEQRRELLVARQTETEGRLERVAVERDQARVRREAIEAALAEVDDLARRLTDRAAVVEGWIERLGAAQRIQSEAARQVSAELTARRGERQKAERDLVDLRERRSRLDVTETESRVKLEALTDALRRELDAEPDVAMAAPLPEIEAGDDGRVPTPQARVRDLERELKLLGPINPLALEEYEALKERHEFIDGQLEDVKSARRDLNTLIRSIDEEIVTVFTSAFADVTTNFTDLFGTMFPGGTGRVALTDTEDLLNCGVEIEAKPSGKNVKKLSLLSGGERALVALTFLFAVFRSRPSPFYVMDEVEAALDDVNLSRFLSLVEEFRKDAQLIIVSHQKRTMEAADVLYGVSMKPGGSSKVVSEKVEGRRTSEPVIDLEREAAAVNP